MKWLRRFKKDKKSLSKGMIVIFIRQDGCQGYNNIQWVGKINGFIDDKAVIEVIVENYLYGSFKGHPRLIKKWLIKDIQTSNNVGLIYN